MFKLNVWGGWSDKGKIDGATIYTGSIREEIGHIYCGEFATEAAAEKEGQRRIEETHGPLTDKQLRRRNVYDGVNLYGL